MQAHGHRAVEDEDKDKDLECDLSDPCKPRRKSGQKACRFYNEDLPGLPHTMMPFHDLLMPHWIFYFASLDSPWRLINSAHVLFAQKLWNKTFLKINCTVTLRNDPIFALVCLLSTLWLLLTLLEIKQHTYDWQSDIATCAHQAVEAFFHQYKELDSPVEQADYVKWAVPEVIEVVDAHGRREPVAPNLFPYMWAAVLEGDLGDPVSDLTIEY